MKKLVVLLISICFVGLYLFSAQDTSFSIREVRDPVQLKAKLEANATDAEARMAVAITNGAAIKMAQSQIATNNVGVKTITWVCAGGTNFSFTVNTQGIVSAVTITAP